MLDRSASYCASFVKPPVDRKSTRLNSSHMSISYAVFCLKKKKVASLMAPAPANQKAQPLPVDRLAVAQQPHPEAAVLFAGARAGCHDAGAPIILLGRPRL